LFSAVARCLCSSSSFCSLAVVAAVFAYCPGLPIGAACSAAPWQVRGKIQPRGLDFFQLDLFSVHPHLYLCFDCLEHFDLMWSTFAMCRMSWTYLSDCSYW
jgi:hypothetical protein